MAKPCMFCGSERFSYLTKIYFQDYGLVEIKECLGCGLIGPEQFIGTGPIKNAYSKTAYFLSQDTAHAGYRNYIRYDAHRNISEGKVFGKFLKKIKDKGSVLEIGCASGHFLKGLSLSCEWDTSGLDISGFMAKNASADGINIACGMFEEVKINPNSFDAVCMRHVLEHMGQPVYSLEKAKDILKPGGVLLIEIPNGELDIQLFMSRDSIVMSPHNHLYFFKIETIKKMLNKLGFGIINITKRNYLQSLRTIGALPSKRDLYGMNIVNGERKLCKLKKRSVLEYFLNSAGFIGKLIMNRDYEAAFEIKITAENNKR